MKDFVEEVGVQGRMDEACKLMDDAQLRDEPVYVHCKAGRSRSVTMVLAFLIHRNNWPLKKAYAHVSERRPGISPNIGFVSELMKFEERTISSTRQTIENVASTYHATNPDLKAPERPPFNAFYSAPLPRTQRDSMPPPASSSLKPGPGWRGEMRKGDGSWAVEGRDMDLPRRASKAGLESSF
ncbi:DSPc-domain-containing protein [Atractiella rhizophila]|nr:DSPc-domain-containing protein [Atractiella rhizophila]